MAHRFRWLAFLAALTLTAPGCARPSDRASGRLSASSTRADSPSLAPVSAPSTAEEVEAAARSLLMAAEPTTREEDWRALGRAVLGVLERLAQDPAGPPTTRARAIAALAAISEPEGCAVLERLAADFQHPPPFRAAAAVALGRCGGAAALRTLRPLLRDTSGQVREATARALGSMGSDEARVALEEALAQEEDGALREAFQHQLARMQL